MPQGILDWKKHPVLMQLPLHIKIIDNVKKITGEIDCAKHCNGINDPACYSAPRHKLGKSIF